jgi:copper chaperone CopZ
VIRAVFAGVLVAMSGAFGFTTSPCPCEASVQTDTQSTITIEIPEVECAGCSPAIRKAVKDTGGVVRIAEGNPKNRIVLTYEPAAGRPDAYVAAIQKAGFPKAHEVTRT